MVCRSLRLQDEASDEALLARQHPDVLLAEQHLDVLLAEQQTVNPTVNFAPGQWCTPVSRPEPGKHCPAVCCVQMR